MENQGAEHSLAAFGRRKFRPRVCVVDGKAHIRSFLSDALEDLGFITCECEQAGELAGLLNAQVPDLIVLGLSAGGVDGAEILKGLTATEFGGKVLILGARFSPMVTALQAFGEGLGLAMLPILATPFAGGNLRDSVATLLPIEPPPQPPVDVAGAMSAGWLELWYQPKVDTHTVAVSGAEALIRMRHPTWGIVTPAYFITGRWRPTVPRSVRVRDRPGDSRLARLPRRARPYRNRYQSSHCRPSGSGLDQEFVLEDA
jgi:DNA-binding response OmpR family regulator